MKDDNKEEKQDDNDEGENDDEKEEEEMKDDNKKSNKKASKELQRDGEIIDGFGFDKNATLVDEKNSYSGSPEVDELSEMWRGAPKDDE